MPRSSPFSIDLSDKERTELESRARKYTSPYRDVIRAKIILLAAEGLSNEVIASRLDLPRQIGSKWRKRFFRERVGGEFIKSRGNQRLVKAATVLPPLVRDKADRLFPFVDTGFCRPSLQSSMTTIAVEVI